MEKGNLLQKTIKSQKIASNPENSAWVFASAGSGKTKILIDRLLRLLLSGAKGGKILCVTFTKVAALEMQERVNDALKSWMVMEFDEMRKIVEDLTGEKASNSKVEYAKSLFLKSMDGENAIKIVTIHSLCQDILKIFPFESAISPNFEVMDQGKEKLFLEQSKKAVFGLCAKDKELESIVTRINGEISQDEFLMLLSKYLANKEKILLLKRKFFNIDNIIDYLYKILAIKKDERDKNHFEELKKEIDFGRLSQLLHEISQNDKRAKMDGDFLAAFENFHDKTQGEVVDLARKLFFTKEGKKKVKILSKKFEQWVDFANDLQEKFEYFFDLVNSYIVASYNELILKFVDKILMKYQELKLSNHLLDYNDLIVKVNELLNDEKYREWIRYRLDGFYDHILIDESQDTNMHQWSIIRAICEDFFTGDSGKDKGRTIFVIGDDKQSIFGFQGADPGISKQQYEYYKNLSGDGENSIKKLSLHNSFRSLSQVLEFVDGVFASQESFVEAGYETHNAIRQGEGKVEVWPIFNEELSKEADVIDFVDSLSAEVEDLDKDGDKLALAKHIAQNISSWVDEKRQITKRSNGEQESAVEYRDIMIVLRNQTNGFSDILKKVLLENRIPFKGDSKISFKDNVLLMDLLALAKFALLPIDDLNLAALLKSGFFKVDEEGLLKICNLKNEQDSSIFEILEEYNQEIYQKLLKIIDLAVEFDIFEFYLELIDENYVNDAKNELGDVAQDIIDEFFLLINEFVAKNEDNLQYFVDFIEKINPQVNLEMSDGNSVIITTIHSSKGLQSPIVIVPDCAFNFNKMVSVTDSVIWVKRQDENYGEFELPIWLARKKYSSKILDRELNYRKIGLKEEYLRLFYVALTRAENELYIGGFGKDNDPSSWYNLVK